ncbi:MAG: WD40 repeat domain-containing protein, partial [Pseudanabaena sp.]
MQSKSYQQPKSQDAVLGGQAPPPLGGVVLGGIAGVKRRLASPAIAPRISALREALNYGETGLNLILQGLQDESLQVQRTALLLLWRRPEPYIRQIVEKYSQFHLFDIVDTLQGHQESISTLALSANGRILYSAGADFTIKVWDLGRKDNSSQRQSKQIGVIRGHTQIVTSIALSANGRILVSGSRDKTIKLWDARSGKELLTLTGHIGYVNSVAITPDGKTLVTGSQDTTIKLWDIKTGREIQTFRGHTSLVDSVSLSP